MWIIVKIFSHGNKKNSSIWIYLNPIVDILNYLQQKQNIKEKCQNTKEMYKNIVLWGQKRKKVEHDFSYVFVAKVIFHLKTLTQIFYCCFGCPTDKRKWIHSDHWTTQTYYSLNSMKKIMLLIIKDTCRCTITVKSITKIIFQCKYFIHLTSTSQNISYNW